MTINSEIISPLSLQISFSKVFDHYAPLVASDDKFIAAKARRVLEIQENSPKLYEGFEELSLLEDYKEEIRFILQDSFSAILTHNEIKTASVPFHNLIFNESARFQKILKEAGPDFELTIRNMPLEFSYIIACTIILSTCYGHHVDYKRPFFYDIPDSNGLVRTYRILYNADFIEIIPTPAAKKITQKDVDELLDNFDNLELWKEKFPPNSYIFKGFVISNIFDVTTENAISEIKSALLENRLENQEIDRTENFEKVFRTLFNIQDLRVGVTNYNPDGSLEPVYEPGYQITSHLLGDAASGCCDMLLCPRSFKALIEDNVSFAISDVDKYEKLSKGAAPYAQLKAQGVKSAILAPIADGNRLLGILELVSSSAKVLNSINANKLIDVLPYIVSSVQQAKADEENQVEAIIQKEYTAIHQSVVWRFEQEAKNYMRAIAKGEEGVLHEISFDQVYPLFGQIDIKGSSEARNYATQEDLKLQLEAVVKVVHQALGIKKLPIYEALQHRLQLHLDKIKDTLQVDSEQQISSFLHEEIQPLFQHLAKENPKLASSIEEYDDLIDQSSGLIYHHRKKYDDTITLINKNMANILDKKQEEAQQMYPHFFERFKTDGVEHNMYIGEAITKQDSFNEVYLYNLRLWQLQVMCEMENEYYKLKKNLPVALNVASMILVFSNPLSIRFRMDEKRFDVDGTYNARYEVVKKRVDKAYVKGTEKRITEHGKLCIVYSQKKDEQEYLRYIQFLQARHYLGATIEVLELDDLQGVTGLKAIRVPVLYQTSKKEYYTYDDLMKELA